MKPDGLAGKRERLQRNLRQLRSVAVAFSAGADSTFLLKMAVDTLGADSVVAVTGRSDSLAGEELAQARDLTASIGAQHVVLDTDEFESDDYVSNPTNRCYYCKTSLYTQLERFIAERGLNAIVSGINADDHGDFRPGIEAGREHGVHTPLADAGLTKANIRELSLQMGLPTFDKPASPCLSSRIPYGQSVTPEKLRMIEAAEAFLHGLGIRECRVRHHDTLARIEVAPAHFQRVSGPENARRIDEYFRSLGYRYVALDLRGFRSGSLNEVITLSSPGP